MLPQCQFEKEHLNLELIYVTYTVLHIVAECI